jgi:hypothetical protein
MQLVLSSVNNSVFQINGPKTYNSIVHGRGKKFGILRNSFLMKGAGPGV